MSICGAMLRKPLPRKGLRFAAACESGRENIAEGDFMRTEYLLEREVLRVLAALTPENRLVMRTALHTGLRVSDVLALRPDQLAQQFWITEGKTGKRRRVNLPRDLLRELRYVSGEHWVFEGRSDKERHRSRQAVWADVKRAARAFRLPQNVGPHSFRKVYAVRLLEQYGDIDRVRRALNHSSIGVTMVYAMADKLLHDRFRAPARKRQP